MCGLCQLFGDDDDALAGAVLPAQGGDVVVLVGSTPVAVPGLRARFAGLDARRQAAHEFRVDQFTPERRARLAALQVR